MYKLIVEKDAEEEVEDIYSYFVNFVSESIAKNFLAEYKESLNRIKVSPERYSTYGFKYKKYVFRKFKYVLYFYIDKTNIKIIAVLHQRRDAYSIISKKLT